MGYRKNVRKLKKFLRDNKALTKFKLNCKNSVDGKYVMECINFDYALKRKLVRYNIGSGFVWSITPEGYAFWSRLSDKFDELR